MNLKQPRRKVEIESASGTLRVTITPQFSIWVILEIAGFLAFFVLVWKQSPNFYREHPLFCALFGLGMLRGLWYQVSGSEEIEFSQQRLMIRTDRPLWPKSWEAPLQDCANLQTHEPSEEHSNRFSCRVGGSTVTFGKDLSPEQADEIMIELQRALPDVADRLLASGAGDPYGKHFTTLNLS
jgi:hypothetical protein